MNFGGSQSPGGLAALNQQPAMPSSGYNPSNMQYMGNQNVANAGNMVNNWSGFNPGQFNQFMNPYQQNVVNNMANQTWRDFGQQQAPMLASQFGSSGQFGSGRADMAMEQAARDTQYNLNRNQSQLMNQGFQNAMNNYSQFQQNNIAGANTLNNIGQTGWNMSMQQQMAPLQMLSMLAQIGGSVRMPNQQQSNTNQNSPWNMPGW